MDDSRTPEERLAFLEDGFDRLVRVIMENADVLRLPRCDEEHPAGMDGFEAAIVTVRELAAIRDTINHMKASGNFT